MIVTIHQPNFMPWYPFFQKMASADLFILLAHCQFEKNGYQNRFDLNDKWFTMSVNRGLEPIYTKKYVNPIKDWELIKQSLGPYRTLLNNFDDCISDSLAETNTAIIKKIAELLQIKTKIVQDYETGLNASERLVRLCKDYNATIYLSGKSGKKYLDLDLFNRAEIQVLFQDESRDNDRPILEILKSSV